MCNFLVLFFDCSAFGCQSQKSVHFDDVNVTRFSKNGHAFGAFAASRNYWRCVTSDFWQRTHPTRRTRSRLVRSSTIHSLHQKAICSSRRHSSILGDWRRSGHVGTLPLHGGLPCVVGVASRRIRASFCDAVQFRSHVSILVGFNESEASNDRLFVGDRMAFKVSKVQSFCIHLFF